MGEKFVNRSKISRRFFWVVSAALAAVILCTGLPASADAGFPGSFAELSKNASPAVVNISAVKIVKSQGGLPMPFGQDDPFKDFFEFFYRDRQPRDFKQQSLGSGFIIDKEGFILTNNHVVESTDEIKVKLADGREFNAEIVGRDPKTDLALIRIEPESDLPTLSLGDSETAEVGDWVIAIGNPFGLGHTVTAGIISAKYRQIGAGSYDNFIQTDASINPGNSGGPLLNTAGEAIGINTAIFSRSGGNIGIGFAIPINMAKDILPQLKEGKVVRGWLGVMIQEITPELKEKLGLSDSRGALVADVTSGGPAEKAGIKRGDVIVGFNGKEIKEMKELPFLVASSPVGSEAGVEIVRNGKRMTITVTLGRLTDEKEEGAPVQTRLELGMSLETLTPEKAAAMGLAGTEGVVVTQVVQGSPASGAGIRQGDVIVEVDKTSTKNVEEFEAATGKFNPGDTMLLLIKRRGATLFLTLKIPE
ncbi:MAG TPA: DegQ family serine endoprotease [Desulfobacteraceae bacterium]|nr:DegQ family serine endoprotease [Desulfobacteraceae bacterium]